VTEPADSAAAGADPAFVLVAPQMGENIGAAARAMWNFGLDGLRLVAPRDGWPNPKAEAMASGAAHLLEHARVVATTAEACADLTYVFATTARDRALTKLVLTPEQAMAEARAMAAAGERVGILFGPERSGLESADIVRSNAVVSVPVNPAFGSLNLGQCVLLMAYEWRRAVGGFAAVDYRLAGGRRATAGEVDRFVAQLVDRLDSVGFFFPDTKRASMIANLDNLFRRAPLTDADVRTLHGVVRALAEKHPRGATAEADDGP
jgi:tRNA/rRNA methyltransferase